MVNKPYMDISKKEKLTLDLVNNLFILATQAFYFDNFSVIRLTVVKDTAAARIFFTGVVCSVILISLFNILLLN